MRNSNHDTARIIRGLEDRIQNLEQSKDPGGSSVNLYRYISETATIEATLDAETHDPDFIWQYPNFFGTHALAKGEWHNDITQFGEQDGFSNVGYLDKSSEFDNIFSGQFVAEDFPHEFGKANALYLAFAAKWDEKPRWIIDIDHSWVVDPEPDPSKYQLYVLRVEPRLYGDGTTPVPGLELRNTSESIELTPAPALDTALSGSEATFVVRYRIDNSQADPTQWVSIFEWPVTTDVGFNRSRWALMGTPTHTYVRWIVTPEADSFNNGGVWARNTPTTMGEFVTLVGTYNSGDIKTYINGVLENSMTSQSSTLAPPNGVYRFEPINTPVEVEELIIYGHEVTQPEVTDYYNHGIVPDSPALHWDFNQRGTTTVEDKSGNGYDGTLSGTAGVQFRTIGEYFRMNYAPSSDTGEAWIADPVVWCEYLPTGDTAAITGTEMNRTVEPRPMTKWGFSEWQ